MNAELNGRLARTFQAYNWIDRAAVFYRRAADLAPRDHRWWYYLGRIQAENGSPAEAQASLGRSLELKSDQVPALLFLGELALKEGALADARRWFSSALEADPRSPHALAGLGQVDFQEGGIANAVRRYEEALRLAPRFGKAMYQLALARRALGESEIAEELLRRHAGSDKAFAPPDSLLGEVEELRRDSDQPFRRGSAAFKEGKYDEAIGLFRTALERNPDLAMAEYDIGLALQQLGRHEEAAPHYESFLRRQPGSADARNNLGLAYLQLGRRDEAILWFEKAIAAEPGYAKGHFNLGLAFEAKGEPDAALEHFKAALEIQPAHAEAHFHAGRILLRGGQDAAAEEHFLETLKAEPGHGGVIREMLGDPRQGAPDGARHRQLAAFLKGKRLFEAAIQVLRLGLRDASEDWRSAIALAWMLSTCPDAKLCDPVEALRLAEPACRSAAAQDPAALDTLAAAYAAAGRFEDALRAARKAVELAQEAPVLASMPRLAPSIRKRIEAYAAGKAFHEE